MRVAVRAAGRWPLAAGRWPLAAGRWPLAAGRWPLAAGLLYLCALYAPKAGADVKHRFRSRRRTLEPRGGGASQGLSDTPSAPSVSILPETSIIAHSPPPPGHSPVVRDFRVALSEPRASPLNAASALGSPTRPATHPRCHEPATDASIVHVIYGTDIWFGNLDWIKTEFTS